MSRTRPLLILFTVLTVSAAAAPSVLIPGRYRITIRPELPLPAPDLVSEACLTGALAERPEPPRGKPADDCRTISGGLHGNVLNYVMKCDKRDSATTARFTYDGNTFEGVVEGKVDGRRFRQVYSGTRIGDCIDEPQPTTAGGDQ